MKPAWLMIDDFELYKAIQEALDVKIDCIGLNVQKIASSLKDKPRCYGLVIDPANYSCSNNEIRAIKKILQ